MKKILCIVAFLVAAQLLYAASPEASVRKAKVKAGDPVEFSLKGDASVVEFFSGEKLSEYQYSDRDRIVDPRVLLSFETAYVKGKQYDPLRVMCSYDYDGELTESSINAARWRDITRYCAMPGQIRDTDSPDVAPTPSGEVDITGFFPSDGRPLYICYFYTVKPFVRSEWNSRTMVSVKNMKIESDAAGIRKCLLFENKKTLRIVPGDSYDSDDNKPEYGGKSGMVSVRFTSEQKPETERKAYAITSPIERPAPFNMGPDEAEVVKRTGDAMPTTFTHCYEASGTYESVVVFHMSDGSRKVEKFKISVK